MKACLSFAALTACAALIGAAPAQAVEYKNLEDFALSTFDTCARVVSKGAAADAAFTAMGYGPGPKPGAWYVEASGWASMVTLHSAKVPDGRTYTQCVTTFTPPPTDAIAFNTAFRSRVVANGVGVQGQVSKDAGGTVTSYVDKARGLILNIGTTTGADGTSASLTYSVVTP